MPCRFSAGTGTSATISSSSSCATRAASRRWKDWRSPDGTVAAGHSAKGVTTMIDFELSPDIAATYEQLHMLAEHAMRPIAREYDEREHEKPWDFINMMWQLSRSSGIGPGAS